MQIDPIVAKANEIAEVQKYLKELGEYQHSASKLCYFLEDIISKAWEKERTLRRELSDLATHSLDEPPQP